MKLPSTGNQSCPRGLVRLSLGLLALVAIVPFPGRASEGSGFRQPSVPLAAIVELPRSPIHDVSPDGRFILERIRPGAEALADLASPERPLAGMKLDPTRPGPSRVNVSTGVALLDGQTGRRLPVDALPANTDIGHVAWSPDGNTVALALVDPAAWRLALLECATGRLELPTTPPLNAVFGNPLEWQPDSRGIVVRTVAGAASSVASADTPVPRVEETEGRKSPGRTWQDLLRTAADEAEFTRLATSRLVHVEHGPKGWTSGELPLEPAVFTSCSFSPDGTLLLLEQLRPPWSRLRPWDDFPTRIHVTDLQGHEQALVTDRPLADQVPVANGSCVTGPRDVAWRPDAPATLAWAEALDGGDARVDAPLRDALLLWPAPFDGEPLVIHRTRDRLAGVSWSGADLALVWSTWWPDRRRVCERIRPGEPTREPELVSERNWQDRYNDPGRPLEAEDGRGGRLLLRSTDGDTLYYSGRGASPEGDRPFLDAVSLSGDSRRLYQSPAGRRDALMDFDPGTGRLLLVRENRTDPPNLWSHFLADGRERQMTFEPHPYPWLDHCSREVIHYTRTDGVALHGTLWLPPGWTPEQGPLPTLLWAYPDEFRSADTAGQVTGSPDRFERLSWASPVIWVQKGFAVLDDPSMPIIGEGEQEPNDDFVVQLVGNARAAIGELARRGVCDSTRVVVGGHSYGAFMAANLLAHSDLFAAGLAFSGAYNRTLTPFGFQSEDRTFWQAPDVYMDMSPLAHADRIQEPLLLIHGESDNNAGTHLQQSERMYDALKGLGGTARLCVLPWEGHGYRARENQLQVLWEVETWLDRHVIPERLLESGGE